MENGERQTAVVVKELEKSEERFHSLFEVIPDIVIVYDEQGIIRHINETGVQRLEWQRMI